MQSIFPGRFTAQIDGPFVVFIIGLRVNRFWAVHKWLPVARAMGPMIDGLLAQPDLGLLCANDFLSTRRRSRSILAFVRSARRLLEKSEGHSLGGLEAAQSSSRGKRKRGDLARNVLSRVWPIRKCLWKYAEIRALDGWGTSTGCWGKGNCKSPTGKNW